MVCYCFVISEDMLESGEGITGCQSNIMTGSHWGITDWCHACQSTVCVYTLACGFVLPYIIHIRVHLSAHVCLCVSVCVCSLSLHTCQSFIPSGIHLPMIEKGGVSEEWQREGVREEQKNRTNRWSESHRCLHSFSTRLSVLMYYSEVHMWSSPLNSLLNVVWLLYAVFPRLLKPVLYLLMFYQVMVATAHLYKVFDVRSRLENV